MVANQLFQCCHGAIIVHGADNHQITGMRKIHHPAHLPDPGFNVRLTISIRVSGGINQQWVLAGYDPTAASRVWEAADRRYGSSAAAQGFLYDHPLNADRMRETQIVAAQVGLEMIVRHQSTSIGLAVGVYKIVCSLYVLFGDPTASGA